MTFGSNALISFSLPSHQTWSSCPTPNEVSTSAHRWNLPPSPFRDHLLTINMILQDRYSTTQQPAYAALNISAELITSSSASSRPEITSRGTRIPLALKRRDSRALLNDIPSFIAWPLFARHSGQSSSCRHFILGLAARITPVSQRMPRNVMPVTAISYASQHTAVVESKGRCGKHS